MVWYNTLQYLTQYNAVQYTGLLPLNRVQFYWTGLLPPLQVCSDIGFFLGQKMRTFVECQGGKRMTFKGIVSHSDTISNIKHSKGKEFTY